MRNPFFILILSPIIAISQVAKEEVSIPDDQMSVSTEIQTSSEFEAPRMQGTIRGVAENLPAARSPESVIEEVQQQQSRLTRLYKVYRVREAEGIPTRFYGLSLTIRSSGEVDKVVVKGPTNEEFIKEIQAIVSTWSFSKVMDGKPYVANLKNLDFTFRRNLILE
jgi:hypothetical protein